jgi:hypothetical protein
MAVSQCRRQNFMTAKTSCNLNVVPQHHGFACGEMAARELSAPRFYYLLPLGTFRQVISLF